MQWFCREPHQCTEILIINVDENSSVMHGTLDTLLLNATAVSDFFFLPLTEKAYHAIIWVRTSEPKPANKNIRHVAQSKLVRNSTINIHLPLMIFIRMHSQESQFHNKCLICSIKFINYVYMPPVCAFGTQIQTHDASASPAESMDEKSKKFYYRS